MEKNPLCLRVWRFTFCLIAMMTLHLGHVNALGSDSTVLSTSLQTMSTNEDAKIYTILPPSLGPQSQNNSSLQQGCLVQAASKREFIPWNNPENIVSAEVESVSRRIKDNMLVFLFLIGGPGNIINMVVFFKQGLKDRVNLCLFALALADELHLTTHMIYGGELLRLQFTTDAKFGPVRILMTNHYFLGLLSFGFVSSVLSAIIAIERCHCVLSPLSYQTLMRTRTMAAIIIAVYVVVCSLYFVTTAFRFHLVCMYNPISDVKVMSLAFTDFYQEHKKSIDILQTALFGVGLPLLVITSVSVTTIITAVRLHQIVTWRTATTVSISSREVGLTKMLIGTSVLFIVCIIPTALARTTSLFFPEMNLGRRHHNFFQTLLWGAQLFTYVNSSFNIFVYYVMGSRYRETFWALLRKRSRRENQTA